MAVGGPGREQLFGRRLEGVTWLSHGSRKGKNAAGVGRQTPGTTGVSKVIGANRPSFARNSINRAAARAPYRMPWCLGTPSGIPASEFASAASRFAAIVALLPK